MSRVLLRSLLGLALAVAASLVGWEVLAPAEVSAPADTPYPAVVVPEPGVTGRTNVAPLIVDGRIRVYAAKRQLRADAPVDAKTVYTPRWSLRRWPQQLSGVVADGATVVSRWSDGELVAVDGRTGRIAWRADALPAPRYAGHRTGAATVWAPPGLHVAAGAVLVTDGRRLAAYDLGTGVRRWQIGLPPGCADGFTTAGGRYVCPTGAYDTGTGRPVASWPAGPYTPLGCGVAASHCAGLRDGSARGWIVDRPQPRRSMALDQPGSTVAAGFVFSPAAGRLRAQDPAGTVVHDFADGQVLGGSGDRVVLLGPNRDLVEIDPRTGTTLARFPLAVGTERTDWSAGLWQVTDGYVAIERLTAGGPADPDAPGHYFTVDTVIIAAL